MKLSDKDIKILNGISQVTAVFTLMVAITMIFGFIQLKVVKPLDSTSLQSVKEQYDKDPSNREKADEVRAMDLMARRAYFTSRWQVETGSYLLLAGAVIFILTRRIIAGSEKPEPTFPGQKPDISVQKTKSRIYLISAASVITATAIVSSFFLRTSLPTPGRQPSSIKAVESTEAIKPVASGLPVAGGTNFPFFRGEGSRGLAGGSGYPVEWNGNDGKNIKWKIPVPGRGKNSPVIWGNKIFLTGIRETRLEVYCVDKTKGEILWTASASDFPGASKEIPESDAEAGMAVPTAAVNGEVVCAIFGNGNLVCFDLNGKRLWGKNIGIPKSTYGYAASLLIYNKILVVQYDSESKIAIRGFDLASGEQKWETARPGRPVWSSPVMAIFDGQSQVILNGNPNVSSYDPVTGAELWSQPGVSGDVAPSPAVNSRFVYAVTDYAKLIAMKPGKTGSKLWEDNTFTPDVSSPVADEQFLFLTTGNGDAACYDAEKGDTLWSHIFNNPFYASPIICDGKLWMLDRKGIMHVADASGKFKLLAESPLGENTDSSPAFSDGRIYLRGKNNLFCISKD
ncbi:MAG: PQQ-binding-like beta-propeller repeat protein [Bacteroidales bacterium]|jgi:outer membrane protein assembly factor BamB